MAGGGSARKKTQRRVNKGSAPLHVQGNLLSRDLHVPESAARRQYTTAVNRRRPALPLPPPRVAWRLRRGIFGWQAAALRRSAPGPAERDSSWIVTNIPYYTSPRLLFFWH